MKTYELGRSEEGVVVVQGARGGGDLPIREIWCVGRNYAAHAAELGNEAPERPMFFSKNLASLALDGEDIVIPKACQDREQVDYEGEIAVVIGRDARDLDEASAAEFILGVCCANDVSARWWQKEGSGGQFHKGKSFDTFCPIGARVAEVEDLESLALTTRLNGGEVQSTREEEMIFSIPRLLAEASQGTTLLAGTILLTGTPSGVGAGRRPPRFLREGDVVKVEIEGVGRLTNTVRLES